MKYHRYILFYSALVFFLVYFVGCKSAEEKKVQRIVDFIDEQGIDKFKNVEFQLRDSLEKYAVFQYDTVYTRWQYDRKTAKFMAVDSSAVKRLSDSLPVYLSSLQERMLGLEVESVTQSDWPGQVIWFWISDAEYLIYVSPDFEFNTTKRTMFQAELKNYQKIDDHFYYKKLKLCRNK